MRAKKEIQRVLNEAEQAGWSYKPSRNGHWRLTHPEVPEVSFIASTASDHRTLKNSRAMLARQLRLARANQPNNHDKD